MFGLSLIAASLALLLSIPKPVLAQLDRTGWTVNNSDSAQGSNPSNNVLDGNNKTIWHTQWTPSTALLPHNITIDMKTVQSIGALTYLPRQDGQSNGNIGKYAVDLSNDGQGWIKSVASGKWADNRDLKTTSFEAQTARFVRLRALTEAGNRGNWTSVAEINVFPSPPPVDTSKGKWSIPFDTPLVAAAGAVLPTGQVLLWSAQYADHFRGTGNTETAICDPSTKTVSDLSLANTEHDMFCPGISLDANGKPVVTGGNDAPKASIYNVNEGRWSKAPDMKIPRGYQSQTTLSNGNIFTIGGSWSGDYTGTRDGELFNETGWYKLPGCPVSPMLTQDRDTSSGQNFRRDNHGWLFGWRDASVFQAGPSKAMNWYRTTNGTGKQFPAGLRSTDADAMNGNAIMYDAVAGKILTVGGAPNYENKTGVNYVTTATTNAFVITIDQPNTTVKTDPVSPMESPRAFHNSVVLPDGSVLVTGGMKFPKPFKDDQSALAPELWTPSDTNPKFKTMNPMTVPRNYHSIALLLPDATVLNAGGGLCQDLPCENNHFDAEIFSPPYLFQPDGSLAVRPNIISVSAPEVTVGRNLTVKTDGPVEELSLVRFSAATHSVNTDQRRVPLQWRAVGVENDYTVTVPADAGVVIPGYWMLFAVSEGGVPSLAKTVQIRTS
ncbi:MAG: hypothetical protein L6R40_001238 [Gallowayella cf. fulva]|nr:MAG: hypothetical protein L6R40_001238 [Xanthomendoza cf. fulva]